MAKKYLIFDTGSLINITQNCLIGLFRELSENFDGKFLITPACIFEAIEHPLRIKRFEWGALRIQSLLDTHVIMEAEEENLVSKQELEKKTNEVLNLINSSLVSNEKNIHLIERGEAECLALALVLRKKGLESYVVIDERTARMLCENPENLRLIMEEKLRKKIFLKEENFKEFKGLKILRSTEIIYASFKKGLIDKDKKKFEAILYALKFGGCSISEKEIQTYGKVNL